MEDEFYQEHMSHSKDGEGVSGCLVDVIVKTLSVHILIWKVLNCESLHLLSWLLHCATLHVHTFLQLNTPI